MSMLGCLSSHIFGLYHVPQKLRYCYGHRQLDTLGIPNKLKRCHYRLCITKYKKGQANKVETNGQTYVHTSCNLGLNLEFPC